MAERPRVVIVGAGFGGLWAARTMAGSPADVLLFDRSNFHTFLPLLYQVAAAELDAEDIAYPVRSILRKLPGIRFAMAEVTRVDLASQIVESARLVTRYDFLIVATGSTSHFWGVPGAAQHAFALKTLEQGIALRNHILSRFERAAHEPDADRRRQLLTFVIVGGGPTGVEFAGALAELIHKPLTKDFPRVNFGKVPVVLVEAGDSLLPSLPEPLRAYTLARLRKMGIEVRLKTMVSRITREDAHLKDGTVIPTETVVWTAGVRGEPMAQMWGLPAASKGRVTVLPTLQLPGHPEVYVVGDLASIEDGGHPLPMTAPVAIQQGVAAARNITRRMAGSEPVAFRYRDRGTMVAIGRNAAVANLGRWSSTGLLAWALWLSVHLFNLIGFRNRLMVLINWAWAYLFSDPAVRLILSVKPVRASAPMHDTPKSSTAPDDKSQA